MCFTCGFTKPQPAFALLNDSQSSTTILNPMTKTESRTGACQDRIASDLALVPEDLAADGLTDIRKGRLYKSRPETYLLAKLVGPVEALVATSLPLSVSLPSLPFPLPLGGETHGTMLPGWLSQQSTACWSPNRASAVQVIVHAFSTAMLRTGLRFASSQARQVFMSVTLDLEVHMQSRAVESIVEPTSII